MIVFSFAFRERGHSPCNMKLAKAAKRAIENQNEGVVIVAQRTTAAALKDLGIPVAYVIEKKSGYEGSEEVVEQADPVFRRHGIDEVIPIAHSFLHIFKCRGLVAKKGYKTPSLVKNILLVGWVGFDWFSVQPWTRDPVRLVLYTFRQIFLDYKPPRELSE